MRRKKLAYLFMALCVLFLSGCGKPEKQDGGKEGSAMFGSQCFTEEGILQINNSSWTGKADYFDFKTKSFRPLCGSPSCTHDSEECFAVYLRIYVDIIGRLGDRWYYQKVKPDGSAIFCSSSLDGQNEKEIGEFSHRMGMGNVYFFDHFVVTGTADWYIEEETGNVSENWKCGIYRFDLETGREELLVPERELSQNQAYIVYGCYENRLMYMEQTDEEGLQYEVRILDLETGAVTKPPEPLQVWPTIPYLMDGNTVVCNARDGDFWKVVEIDMESGECTEILKGLKRTVEIFWTEELKLLTFREDVEGKSVRKTCRYGENGELVAVRTDGEYLRFSPLCITDGLLVGSYEGEKEPRMDGFTLATIPVEDYLAGKDNFTLLQY